jgi:CRISPR/Cas system-associated exonuclease Cas4 (RecB family)
MNYTNKYNLPIGIFEAISKDNYDYISNSISVTRLIDSPKIQLLKEFHKDDIETDISEGLWRLLGSSVHYVLGNIDSKNMLKEERLSCEIDGVNIVGRIDSYNGRDKSLHDYKVTSVWSVIYAGINGKKEWENQLNCYAWLLKMSGFEVDKLYVNAILRDWSKREAQKNSDYPQIPFVIIPINKWDEDKTETYITERLMLHTNTDGIDIDNLDCSPEERWEEPTTYAVYKKNKSGNWYKRADRVFKTFDEAINYCNNSGNKIKIRQGIDKRCSEYCDVKRWCNYAISKGYCDKE